MFLHIANRVSTPTLVRRVCETQSKKGCSRHRKPFMHRVYSAQRGIETMVRPWSRKGPDHGVGVDPSLLMYICSRLEQKDTLQFPILVPEILFWQLRSVSGSWENTLTAMVSGSVLVPASLAGGVTRGMVGCCVSVRNVVSG